MTTLQPEIRPIQPADVPALRAIIDASRDEYGVTNRAEPALFEAYQRQRTMYFVAVIEGEVVGGAGVAPLAGADPLTCELQRMYLRTDARGRGIGEALLQRCLAAARQFLYVRCYLETVAQMQGALEFYARHGFINLQAPVGRTGHEHNNRWMMRALRASARHWVGGELGW
jgi:putative acetyltransferase